MNRKSFCEALAITFVLLTTNKYNHVAVAHSSAQISTIYKGLSVYRTLPVHERKMRLSKNSPETQLTNNHQIFN